IVDGVSRFSKGEIKNMFGNIKKANITIRNFPDTVQGLRKRLKIDEGGDIYIFATTLFNDEKVLIKCHKA
ncbi:MAG: SAM-dependent methyltransferase, partial [Bacteroidaceae bacterium]|nr:SAM-dependent methyltransferase [Bacteroidaceae bacterium]